MNLRTLPLSIAFCLLLVLASPPAFAYTHVVKPGETLAQIAARAYGDPRLERVLVGANGLDSQGGSAITAGMRLEIPAPGHHRVAPGETWADLALAFLGDVKRADLLARANHAVAWVPPVERMEVEIPAVIAHIGQDNENTTSIALHYWGDANRGWELNAYNSRKEAPLRRGEVVLVPFVDLSLTEAGKSEARSSVEATRSEGEMGALTAQRHADAELPALAADVRSGRYVEVVARGNRLLGTGDLTKPQLAIVHRALLEAYVALEAANAASSACEAWRANDPHASLGGVRISPKIRAACAR